MWNKLMLALNTMALFMALALDAQTLQNQFSPTSYLDTVIEQYDLFVDQKLAELAAPGAAIAIVRGDSTLYMKCFGVRKVGQPEPIDSHTVFRSASLSKGFAAVLTGLLVQDKLLQWDDKVIWYLPNFSLKSKAQAQNLTIRHILSHTSGLPSHTYDNLVEANIPFDMIIEQLKAAPVVWPLEKITTTRM
jgi:beta-lactamase class C